MTDISPQTTGKRRWTSLILPLCIIAGFAFLVSLGNWQMKRLAWKEALISRVEQNLKRPPVTIADIEALLKNGGDIEYRPVRLKGTFLNKLEQYYFATHKEKPGWFVYTPLKRADGSVIFVNRGYVPINKKDPATRLEGQITGEVEIIGLARTAPKQRPNSFVPDNNLQKNEYFWKNIDEMAVNAGFKSTTQLLPFFVDSNDQPNVGGLPIGGVTRIEFTNVHLKYALTWYGLAVTLLVVGGIFMFNRRKSGSTSS